MGAKATQMDTAKDGSSFVLTQAGADIDDGIRKVIADIDKDSPHRVRLLDFWVVLTAAGASSGTLTLQHGDGDEDEVWTSVSDAMSTDGKSSGDIIRATTWDYTNGVLAKYGSLAVLAAQDDHSFVAYCLCRREDA